MRTLLVTSQITFVPRNYQDALAEALESAGDHIFGLLILKNRDLSVLKSLVGLYALGAPKIASTLLKNIVVSPLRKRERLFEKNGKKVFYANSANDAEVIRWVRDNEIDLIVNMRTRCIYKDKILTAPRLGCVNVHHGLLPRYRGTMCDLTALSENRAAGFAIHRMSKKLDDGEILHSEIVSDGAEKDYISYLGRTGKIEGQALAQLIHNTAVAGKLPNGIPNIEPNPIYTKTPKSRAEVMSLKERNMIL